LEKKFLADLVEIQSGYQARGKIHESPDGSHRLLQAKDIDGGTPHWDIAITFNPDLKPDRYRISHNDILFIARGYENKAILAKNPPDNILASNIFYIIKPQKINPGFLAWYLNQRSAQAYFAQFQVKSGYVYMSKKNLSKLEVTILEDEMQVKIAEVLALWEHEKKLTSEIYTLKEQIVTSTLVSAIQKEEG